MENLDEYIINELNPLSYGRYVDDITIVLKRKIGKNIKDEIIELDNRINEILKKFLLKNTNGTTKLEFNSEKKVYFVINKSSDHNYIKKFKNKTEKLSSDFHRLIDVNEMDIEIDSAYEIVENPIKLDELFKINKDKKAITKTISAVFYSLYAEPVKNLEKNKLLAKKFIEKFDMFTDKEMFLEIYDYWLPIILIEMVSININYIDEKLECREFEELKVVKQINILINEINDNEESEDEEKYLKFLNYYMQLFELLFRNEREKAISDILNNFVLPKSLNKMFKNKYLTYESQLSYLNENLKQSNNKIGNFIKEFNNFAFKGVSDSKKNFQIKPMDNSTNNNGCNNCLSIREDEILDVTFPQDHLLGKLKISQVSVPDPFERNQEFIRYSRNTDISSDTVDAMNMSASQRSDILIFPEQGLNITEISKITKFVKRTQIPIVGGLDYILIGDTVLNASIAVLPFRTYKNKKESYTDCAIIIKPKRYPAPEEFNQFSNSSCRTDELIDRQIYIPIENESGINFKFLGVKHSVLNCYEATDLKIKADLSSLDSDFVHIIANNRDVNYYNSITEVISRELMTVSTITNYSVYGGTQVYIPFYEKYKQLVSYHKGSEITHVFTSIVDIDALRNKKANNVSDLKYRQNPPRLFYKNIGRGTK